MSDLAQAPIAVNGRSVITYTQVRQFRNCPKAWFWRNEQHLVPKARGEAMAFGELFHEVLMLWHSRPELMLGADLDVQLSPILVFIDASTSERETVEQQREDWHVARAMLAAYARQYATEPFAVIATEQEGMGEIRNPETAAASRTFVLGFKADSIVRERATGHYYLMEHKVTSTIDTAYIERLWTNLQTTLYARYCEVAFGLHITGIVYNVLAKPRLQQRKGETEEEFQARYAELCAKNKSGKSTAKRQMPETDEEFQGRLAEWYAQPGTFYREQLFVTPEQADVLLEELWELTQQLLFARRRGHYFQNTDFCWHWNRPCEYFPLCSGGCQTADDNPALAEELYRKEEPNSELATQHVSQGEPTMELALPV